jgi:xylan 1,4-beta-xylosidase
VTAKTIKAVDPALPVGGPATSNFVPDDRFAGDKADTTKQITFTAKDVDSIQFKGVWIEDFIAFCAARELPVDFISTHPYPSDVAIHENGMKRRFGRIAEATMRDLVWLRAAIDRSAYPKAEIHLTEWSSSPSPRDLSHDYLPEAAFIVRTNLACLNLVDSLSYWTFTDVFEEEGAGPSILHGGFGLVNYQGLVKPSFHAYRMLNQLGDQVVSQGDEYLVSRCSDSGKITAIMYHYPPEFTRTVPYIPYGEREKAQAVQDTGSAAAVDIDLCGLPANAPFELEVLSCGHGTIMEAWMAQGCPEPPTREQASELNQAVWSTSKEAFSTDQSGRLKIALQFEPWSVALLRQL